MKLVNADAAIHHLATEAIAEVHQRTLKGGNALLEILGDDGRYQHEIREQVAALFPGRITLSVAEFSTATGLSPSSTRELIRSGRIQATKVESLRRVFIPIGEVVRLLTAQGGEK